MSSGTINSSKDQNWKLEYFKLLSGLHISKLCRATVPMCANSSSCSNEQFLRPHPPSARGNLGWETGNAQKLDSSPHLPGSLNPLLINHLSTQRLMDLIILQTPKWFWYGNWDFDKTELRYQNVYQNPRFKSPSFPRFSKVPKIKETNLVFLGHPGEVRLMLDPANTIIQWLSRKLSKEHAKRTEPRAELSSFWTELRRCRMFLVITFSSVAHLHDLTIIKHNVRWLKR